MKNRKSSFCVVLTIMVLTLCLTACKTGIGKTASSSTVDITSLHTDEEAEDTDTLALWKQNTGEIKLGDATTVTGTGVTVDGNGIKITSGGDFTISGTLSDGYIYINTEENVKLRLSGATINCSNGPAIYGENVGKLFVTLTEGTENFVSDGSKYTVNSDAKGCIFSNDSIEIKGAGTLNLTANYKQGIGSDDDIYIKNGTINISAVGDGINCNNELVVTDGNINIEKCEEGLESKTEIEIQGGNIKILATDDAMNAGSSIKFSGGETYAQSTGNDALDSNGTITVMGGTVVAVGAGSPEGGIDCDNNVLAITGGTLVAVGGSNNAPSESETTQYCALIGSANKGETIHIQDSSGSDVLTFVAPTSYSNMLFSSPNMKENEKYSIFTGGSVTGGTNTNFIITGGTFSGGTVSKEFTASSIVISAGGTSNQMGGGGKGGGLQGNRDEGTFDGEKPSGGSPPDKQSNQQSQTSAVNASQSVGSSI